jgi:hypothetical protein
MTDYCAQIRQTWQFHISSNQNKRTEKKSEGCRQESDTPFPRFCPLCTHFLRFDAASAAAIFFVASVAAGFPALVCR